MTTLQHETNSQQKADGTGIAQASGGSTVNYVHIEGGIHSPIDLPYRCLPPLMDANCEPQRHHDHKANTSHIKSEHNVFIARKKEINTFVSLLENKNPAIWLIYGPGGIGKSYFLKHLKHMCDENHIVYFFFDWQLFQGDTIDAVTFWQKTKTGTYSVKPLLRLFKNINAYKQNNAISFFPRFFRRTQSKAIQHYPEKAIIDCLIKFAQKNFMVWLIDNHDLANQITISSCIEDFNDQPKKILFADYLTRLYDHIASHTHKKKVSWITVMTGRSMVFQYNPVNTVVKQEESLLHAFDIGQIKNYLNAIELIKTYEKNKESINQTAQSMFKLTRGNPLLVYLSVNLIAAAIRKQKHMTPIDQLWENEISTFQFNVKTGFHDFVINRLINRLDNNQRIENQLWRLAIPYQLISRKNKTHFDELQNIIFPPKQLNNSAIQPFDQLCHAGILQWDGNIHHPHQFHMITQYSLFHYAMTFIGEDKLIDLHTQLETFYSKINMTEAAHYHRLCGRDRHHFSTCDMTPETYWDLTTANVTLDDHQKACYCFEKLPGQADLQKRVAGLIEVRDNLGIERLCGDANYFLCQKKKQGAFSGNQLSKDLLLQFSNEAPHISDFYFLMALHETDINEKHDLLTQLTKEKNPAHAHAWWELAVLHLRNNKRKDAKIAFENAMNYGVKHFYNYFAKGHVQWMEANPHEAKDLLKQAYDMNPSFPGLRADFTSLLIFLEAYQDVNLIFNQSTVITPREQFLLMTRHFRQSHFSELNNMIETLSIEQFDSWEKEKVNTYMAYDDNNENEYGITKNSDPSINTIKPTHLNYIADSDDIQLAEINKKSDINDQNKTEKNGKRIELNSDNDRDWFDVGYDRTFGLN